MLWHFVAKGCCHSRPRTTMSSICFEKGVGNIRIHFSPLLFYGHGMCQYFWKIIYFVGSFVLEVYTEINCNKLINKSRQGFSFSPHSLCSYLVPVYIAEKCVCLDICEARLDLATQPLLGILLGPRQLVRNVNRSNCISCNVRLLFIIQHLDVDNAGIQSGSLYCMWTQIRSRGTVYRIAFYIIYTVIQSWENGAMWTHVFVMPCMYMCTYPPLTA